LSTQHGDAKLTDLLPTLAACPKARSASIHDRCKAVYADPVSPPLTPEADDLTCCGADKE
jgi:hypothetical protein